MAHPSGARLFATILVSHAVCVTLSEIPLPSIGQQRCCCLAVGSKTGTPLASAAKKLLKSSRDVPSLAALRGGFALRGGKDIGEWGAKVDAQLAAEEHRLQNEGDEELLAEYRAAAVKFDEAAEALGLKGYGPPRHSTDAMLAEIFLDEDEHVSDECLEGRKWGEDNEPQHPDKRVRTFMEQYYNASMAPELLLDDSSGSYPGAFVAPVRSNWMHAAHITARCAVAHAAPQVAHFSLSGRVLSRATTLPLFGATFTLSGMQCSGQRDTRQWRGKYGARPRSRHATGVALRGSETDEEANGGMESKGDEGGGLVELRARAKEWRRRAADGLQQARELASGADAWLLGTDCAVVCLALFAVAALRAAEMEGPGQAFGLLKPLSAADPRHIAHTIYQAFGVSAAWVALAAPSGAASLASTAGAPPLAAAFRSANVAIVAVPLGLCLALACEQRGTTQADLAEAIGAATLAIPLWRASLAARYSDW